jgi:2,4-dienoyl-CoA reductase (NADPH2)
MAPTPHLLSPGRIGSLELRNRILMTPMGSNLAEADGHVGERIQRYYEERARGGAGMLIVGVGAIAWPDGACNPNQVAISDDAFLPGLSELTRRAHAHGARIAIQLQHAGKVAVRDIVEGRPLLGPSVPTGKGANDLLRDLTAEETKEFVANLAGPRPQFRVASREDLEKLVDDFASATERARRAGFDGVELHAGHGYILSSFLSPASNLRDDEWGGPLENRARLLCDTIRAAKQRAGADFPVWARIDARELRIEGGITLEDATRTAQLAEEAGADAVHVSAYADPTSGVAFTDAPLVHREEGFVDFAARIKRAVGIPVIAVGRIEPERAEALLREGRADFVAMGRKLLADPELPRKLAEGRPEDVRPCIYCYTCVAQIFVNRSLYCAVNPLTGHEHERSLEPASEPRQVLVAGGGPAGLEAARVAALRGHRVTLCEKSGNLGGTLRFSSLVYEPNGRLARWLETQVRELGVELRLGQAVTPELVAELAPDVVLVGVGARREAPDLPGVELPHVWSGDDLRALLTGEEGAAAERRLSWTQRALLSAGRLVGVGEDIDRLRELSRRWMPLGRRVAVVGGGLVGVELADFLAERGREVTVLEEGPSFAPQMAPPRRWRALHELREHGVELLAQTRVERIEARQILCRRGDEEPRAIPADAVILAAGVRESRDLADALRAGGCEVHEIGDCGGVGYIEGAIHEGARVAREI